MHDIIGTPSDENEGTSQPIVIYVLLLGLLALGLAGFVKHQKDHRQGGLPLPINRTL